MSTNSSADKQPRREITRRDFLKLAGAAGAVLATLPSFIPFGQVVGGSGSGTNSSTNVNRTTSNLDTSSSPYCHTTSITWSILMSIKESQVVYMQYVW
ncbi:MAG: twin-arginine translocation signal domain-containing protein [Nitrososphaeraceae archaeon]|nr:twin-arginine translocation signal domain-containing protein [Nitrososphaeraceae archaeon]